MNYDSLHIINNIKLIYKYNSFISFFYREKYKILVQNNNYFYFEKHQYVINKNMKLDILVVFFRILFHDEKYH